MRGPLMSHAGWNSQVIGTRPRRQPAEPFRAKGERQKNNWKLHQQRPFRNALDMKKSSRREQLYLENTGIKVEKVSDQGQWGCRVELKEFEAQRDDGRNTRHQDNKAH